MLTVTYRYIIFDLGKKIEINLYDPRSLECVCNSHEIASAIVKRPIKGHYFITYGRASGIKDFANGSAHVVGILANERLSRIEGFLAINIRSNTIIKFRRIRLKGIALRSKKCYGQELKISLILVKDKRKSSGYNISSILDRFRSQEIPS